MPGKPVLAQSNAILVLIGRHHGLHPKDDFEAARHEAMMERRRGPPRATSPPTLRITDEAKKRAAARSCGGDLPTWARTSNAQLGTGLLRGRQLHVADIKLYMIVRWFASGAVDHVPATVFAVREVDALV